MHCSYDYFIFKAIPLKAKYLASWAGGKVVYAAVINNDLFKYTALLYNVPL